MRLISTAVVILAIAGSAMAEPAPNSPNTPQAPAAGSGAQPAQPVPEPSPFDCRSAIWPVAGASISELYRPSNGGIEIYVAEGNQIKAASDGVVIYAGNGLRTYGRLVLIRHGDSFHTVYSHLSVINVRKGQRVARGATIGLSGATGLVSGPQLHFEIRIGSTTIDPLRCLPRQLPEQARLHNQGRLYGDL